MQLVDFEKVWATQADFGVTTLDLEVDSIAAKHYIQCYRKGFRNNPNFDRLIQTSFQRLHYARLDSESLECVAKDAPYDLVALIYADVLAETNNEIEPSFNFILERNLHSSTNAQLSVEWMSFFVKTDELGHVEANACDVDDVL